MANDTIYIRNMRPNRVILLYAGLRVVLERRGSREDTTSLPEDALTDPTIARWLRAGMIEEVSKDAFLDLMARDDAFSPEERSVERTPEGKVIRSLEPELVSDARQVAVPMGSDRSDTPTVIATDKIDKTLLSPRVNYREQPEPTEDPTDISPKTSDIHSIHRGTAQDRPLATPEEEEVSNIAEPKPVRAKAKSTPKKKASNSKSTRK